MADLLPAPPRPADEKALAELWFRLVRAGVREGLALQDAEDLAQESVMAATEAFDPARGDFAGLAYTILRNKARNLRRHARPTVPVDEASPPDPHADPARELGRVAEGEAIDRVAAAILADLSGPEAGLFLELGRVLEELGHGAVSEAARRIGLSPQEGWDLFRKIQRKARKRRLDLPAGDLEWLEREFRGARHIRACESLRHEDYDAIPLTAEPRAEAEDRDDPLLSSASLRAAGRPAAVAVTAEAVRRPWEGYRRFLSGIGDGMRRRLAGLLG